MPSTALPLPAGAQAFSHAEMVAARYAHEHTLEAFCEEQGRDVEDDDSARLYVRYRWLWERARHGWGLNMGGEG